MKRGGFTLIELVIVLVILAILVGLALPTFLGARRKAYRAEALTMLGEIKVLAWAYNIERGGNQTNPVWPANLAALGYANPLETQHYSYTGGGGQPPTPAIDPYVDIDCTIGVDDCFYVLATALPGMDATGAVLYVNSTGTAAVY